MVTKSKNEILRRKKGKLKVALDILNAQDWFWFQTGILELQGISEFWN